MKIFYTFIQLSFLGGIVCSCKSDKMLAHLLPANIEQAFEQMLDVLHLPYEDDEYFAAIPENNDTVIVLGSEKSLGNDKETELSTGTGYFKRKMYKGSEFIGLMGSGLQYCNCIGSSPGPKCHRVVYTYMNYQPQGSSIKINGKLTGNMWEYCQDDMGKYFFIDLMAAKKDKLTFTFANQKKGVLKLFINDNILGITKENYEQKILNSFSTQRGNSLNNIVFSYAQKSIILDKKHIAKLFRIKTADNVVEGSEKVV